MTYGNFDSNPGLVVFAESVDQDQTAKKYKK